MSIVNKKTEQTRRPLYQKVLVLAAMVTTIGGSLTGIMTYVNIGFTEAFLLSWFNSFTITALVLIPISIISMTFIGKLISLVFSNSKKIYQQLIIGFLMALLMESLMALTTTANTIGTDDKTAFINAWTQAFTAALPFGLCIGITMSLFIRPRLQKFMAS